MASGLVSVVCVEAQKVETTLSQIFAGSLSLPSARLKLYDPDESIAITVPTSVENVTVRLYAGQEIEPSDLLVQLTPQ